MGVLNKNITLAYSDSKLAWDLYLYFSPKWFYYTIRVEHHGSNGLKLKNCSFYCLSKINKLKTTENKQWERKPHFLLQQLNYSAYAVVRGYHIIIYFSCGNHTFEKWLRSQSNFCYIFLYKLSKRISCTLSLLKDLILPPGKDSVTDITWNVNQSDSGRIFQAGFRGGEKSGFSQASGGLWTPSSCRRSPSGKTLPCPCLDLSGSVCTAFSFLSSQLNLLLCYTAIVLQAIHK